MITSLKSALQREGFRRYLGNTSWLLGEKFLRLTLGLFVSIWIARYLGPGQYGILSYAESFVALFSALVTLGLNSIVVRELVRNPSATSTLLGTALGLRTAGSLIMLALIAVTVHFLGTGGSADRIILIISAATAFRILEVIDFYFQARVIARYSAISSGCALIASSLLKIYLITRNAPLIAFAWAFLFDAAVINGLYLHFYRHAGGTLKALRFRVQQAARLLSDSWPLIFSGLMISIYMKIDQVMVQHYMGDWYVGQYAAAVKLCDAWLFITVVITNSLFPAIVKAREVSVELFRERMTRLYKLLVFISLVISCVVFLFSRQIVLHTYGADFSNAIPLLQLYVWSIIFVFLNNASWKWYIAENLQRIAMLRLCLGAIVNIGLNMLLIPEFGLQGAAYATLVSYILATYLGNALHRGTRENFRMQTRAILTFYTFNR